jgi:hypothetical protein
VAVVVAVVVVVVDAPVAAPVTSGPAVAAAVVALAAVVVATAVEATELRLRAATAVVPVVAVDTAAALAHRAGGKRTVITPTRPILTLPRSFAKPTFFSFSPSLGRDDLLFQLSLIPDSVSFSSHKFPFASPLLFSRIKIRTIFRIHGTSIDLFYGVSSSPFQFSSLQGTRRYRLV